MTVKELIQKLSKFDETLEVGGSGHFGELLELYDVYEGKDYSKNNKPFIAISIESAGEEPG